MRKFCFILVLVLTFSSNIFAIEVGGHLTEDTIWSPANNPYVVVDDVIVDEGVTLTILPGTEIKFNSTLLMNSDDFDNFIYYNGSNIAKNLIVNGNVIAEGTEDDPIIFTRYQDSLYYHWGVIFIWQSADRCVFKHCEISYSARMMIYVGLLPKGSISIYNAENIIENCDFYDNFCGVYMQDIPQQVIIKNCEFYNIQNIYPNVSGSASRGVHISAGATGEASIALIAGNRFNENNVNSSCISINNIKPYVVFNELHEKGIHLGTLDNRSSYFYQNNIVDCDYEGIEGGGVGDSLFIKNNRFIGGNDGIEVHGGYIEISDNYFEDCDLYSDITNIGKAYNNISNNGNFRLPGFLEVYNNISYDGNYVGVEVSWRNITCHNNLALGNEFAIGSGGTVNYINNIIVLNEELNNFPISDNPLFRNCIIDFPLDPPLIDGGGNIILDSLQAQSIFEDIQNGDFHLTANSIAIDAGLDTLGCYYPFDLDYNHRIWDGDNNGTTIIDIGPYEFGSSAFGGIQGITYVPINGDYVDYVLIKINNEPGDFTFSDSIGVFEYKLPAGIYDIYAERVFYEDVIEYQIVVFDGQFTQLDIPMSETVEVENIEIIPIKDDFDLTNYPNPFNPNTTFSFSIDKDSSVELSIINIKGQKVKTLINEQMQKGIHTSVWSGLDSNNKPVSSGIYLYKIKAGTQESVKRMLLLK